MTASLWRTFLVLLVVRQSIVAWVNSIMGTYCQGAVDKKSDKILAGSPIPTNLARIPTKYCAPLRTKWCYTVRLSDGHKRQFIPLMVRYVLRPPTKRKMTILLRWSYLPLLVVTQTIVGRVNYLLLPSLRMSCPPQRDKILFWDLWMVMLPIV